VLFAYLDVDLLGIALFGLAIAIMFITLKRPTGAEEVAARG
jgi:mannose/fructose/N-acetylgalactosamine-specific phosphotransferase system component IIC